MTDNKPNRLMNKGDSRIPFSGQWRFHALAVCLLVLPVLVVFSDVLFFSAVPTVISCDNGDISRAYAHTRHFAATEIFNGHLPLWMPYRFSGSSFIADPENAMFYPPNVIYLLLPLHWALNLDMILHLLLLGWFMYVWVRRKGYHLSSSLFCAILMMFCGAGFMRLYVGHLNIIATSAWAPLIFCAIDELRHAERLKWFVLGTLAVAMSVLAGNLQYVFFIGLAASLYMLASLAGQRIKFSIISGFLLMYVLGAMMSAVQLLPVIGFMGESFRGELASEFIAAFPLEPENLLTLILPDFFGNMALAGEIGTFTYWGDWALWEENVFIGVAALFLCLYGAVYGRQVNRLHVVIILVLFLIALGPHTIFFEFTSRLPVFKGLRGHGKMIFPATVLLVLLAGEGMNRLVTGKPPITAILLIGVSALMALGGWMWLKEVDLSGWRVFMLFWKDKNWLPPDIYQNVSFLRLTKSAAEAEVLRLGAKLLLLSGVIVLCRRSLKFSRLLLIFMVVEVLLFTHANKASFELNMEVPPVLESLREKDPGDYRVYHVKPTEDVLSARTQDVWGENSVTITERYRDFCYRFLFDPDNWEQSSNGGVIDRSGLTGMLRLKYVITGIPSAINVQRPVMPRLLLLDQYICHTKKEAVLRAMAEKTVDLTSTIILEEDPQPRPVAGGRRGSATIGPVFSNERFVIEADVPFPAVLLITDGYSKGWKAESLNPEIQPDYQVLPADYVLQAIPLRAGHHRILMVYEPPFFSAGKAITLISWSFYLLLAGWLFFLKKSPALFRKDCSL